MEDLSPPATMKRGYSILRNQKEKSYDIRKKQSRKKNCKFYFRVERCK
ncbi:exodeoxyribonuclease VII, large subunit domain protein [Leptospira borgpetersenii str. Noumea 25]|nr:exodeoxyribonuclease VII, large subunit domain protein [Leptospira borgpetersenii str. Noumea 25]